MLVTTQVDDDGADHRPGGGVAEQGDEQRHAHEAGVREGGDERAESGVAQVDAVGAAARGAASRATVRAMTSSAETR